MPCLRVICAKPKIDQVSTVVKPWLSLRPVRAVLAFEGELIGLKYWTEW